MRKISITVLLCALVTISVLMTLTIMVISSYTSQKETIIDNTLSINYAKAVQMSQTLDSLFLSMQGSLKFAADYIQNTNLRDTTQMNKSLDLIRNSSNFFNSVALADEEGLVLSISPYYESSIGKHVSSKAAKEAISSQASYISEAFPVSQDQSRIVFLGEPVFNASGRFLGMIGGNIHLQEYNILNLSFGNQLKYSDGSYFFIVDKKGTLLFHPDEDRIGEDVSKNTVVQKLMNNQMGKARYKNLAGVDSLAGYYKVPLTSWGVVIVTPTQMVFDQLNNHIRMLLIYTAVPFLILTFFVVRFARRLASPFVMLADVINQMDKGTVKLPVIKSHWNREADILTHTVLQAMANFKNKSDQLTYDARTDVLTGINNRRVFDEVIQQWIEEEIPFSLVIFDIDHFKSINDEFGHSAGDEVLKYVASLLRMSVSLNDVCFRFGGEEFVVLMRHCHSKQAYETAERIRITLEASVLPINRSVTISAGIAEYPLNSISATELFSLADSALYQAKAVGRNRTITHSNNN
ncbi:sensor domain-containing diguanylate cyclase [Paenibacillus amylolyticus]|nr:sensor domain-containing diguanylate cyclase [Paenibacillus amylolyticus]WFR60919.1 sensor domain-containing diguanylate cyclase [Paenibacillus amylolyticus]